MAPPGSPKAKGPAGLGLAGEDSEVRLGLVLLLGLFWLLGFGFDSMLIVSGRFLCTLFTMVSQMSQEFILIWNNE